MQSVNRSQGGGKQNRSSIFLFFLIYYIPKLSFFACQGPNQFSGFGIVKLNSVLSFIDVEDRPDVYLLGDMKKQVKPDFVFFFFFSFSFFVFCISAFLSHLLSNFQ